MNRISCAEVFISLCSKSEIIVIVCYPQRLCAAGDQINAESANQQESAVSEKVVFLEPAPSNFSLPSIIPACKKSKDGTHVQSHPEVTAISKRPLSEVANSAARVHKEQPVDSDARQLAQGKAKPACWRDLYWHLVGSRGLKTEEEKVRALFTWICSTSLDRQLFPSAVEEDDAHKVKGKGKHQVDSPDVVLPKLVEGRANYVQVSIKYNRQYVCKWMVSSSKQF
ncbi:unnamed protein product [Hydatigera taeniaeformis]|uniref:PIK helical domain-containing protein n=1 Tax=Hydatigena taeniaeformis TaxID=6205 RepID=A0A0R3X934_HYDTA|nr:unnamed protein product [Hydatigera taeniaeformis]